MVLITSTCIFLAYIIRRKILGKKGEEKDAALPGATGAGGLAHGSNGMGICVRRHGKALIGAAAVLALASGGVFVASRRARAAVSSVAPAGGMDTAAIAALEDTTGAGSADPVLSFLSALPGGRSQLSSSGAAASAAAPVAPRREEEEDEEEEVPARQCGIEAVQPSCSSKSSKAEQQGQEKQQQEEQEGEANDRGSGSKDWALALAKALRAANATSVIDLVLLPSSLSSSSKAAAAAAAAAAPAWPSTLPAEAEAYVGGFVVFLDDDSAPAPPPIPPPPPPPTTTTTTSLASNDDDKKRRTAFLPSAWDPLACPAPPQWRHAPAGCGGSGDKAQQQPQPFALTVLRGDGGGGSGGGGGGSLSSLRLLPNEDGAALLRAVVLGKEEGPAPRYLALMVPTTDDDVSSSSSSSSCPDICSSKARPTAAAFMMRPQCPPWSFPAPRWRVPLAAAEGVELELAVYRAEEDLAPIIRAWPAEGGLCE